MAQLMSQGTGDMLLDACSDYWDGHDLCTFTEIDRKKVTDFYQRTSMSAYCTAFSYRPLTQALGTEFRDLYLEVPEVHNHLYPQTHSPIPSKSWDTESLDSRIQSDKNQYHYSMDSLLNIDSNLIHDIDGAFRIQCNQVFIGMITMQYQARQDVVKLIEDLESACIRFVHYSKENELRSRVFSEKMGLEAGWNCHISLLSEKPAIEEGVPPGNVNVNINYTPPSKMTLASSVKLCNESRTSMQKKPRRRMERVRRESAPGAINLEVTQVTFESGTLTENSGRLSPVRRNPGTSIKGKSGSDMNTVTSSPTHLPNSSQMMRHNSTESDHVTFPLLKNSSGLASTSPTPAPASPDDLSRDQVGVNLDEVELQLLEAEQDPKESDENMSTSESYHASSHFTENTDSVSGGFGLANRAKLPKGIENIRPHIDNVDNVPLLVSLFTDCTPKTTGEMMQILQEYGEVVCCLGSSANIHNTGVFLQADCSLAMEPQYPHVCMRETAVGSSWDKTTPGPLELSNHLYSLPCTLFFRSTDRISIMQLIAQARQHVQMVRHTFLLLLLLQLSLAVLQVLAAMSLPPALCPHHVIWLAMFVLPAICMTMNANPSDRDVMHRALGKNNNHLSSQVVLEFLFYFSLGCVPTILVCLVCHGLNLNHFCHMVADPLNVTCHLFYGSSALGNPGTWNGFATDLSAGLALSQNIVAFQFVLYAGCASMCFVHRHHHVWQRSPFTNHVWCVVIVVLLLLQVIYFSADMALQNSLSVHAFVASDIPMPTLVLALLWPVVLICIQELIKRRERRLSIRYQKRARLDFGTKLGMNSPF